jgi:hypothetical protein
MSMSWREAGRHFGICEQIMRDRPGWIVLWGPVSRWYYAVPLFEGPVWLWAVFDTDPDGLTARMDEVERLAGRRPGREGGD